MIPRELLEQLRYIEIYTQRATRHYLVAEYRSPYRGRGFDFDQHKPYQHGDDYRQIDWNVTARMQRPYVRREFEEKEMSAVIMADLSRSMEFSSADLTKRQLLLEVAAAVAFSAASDNMKIGLLGFTDRIEVELPCRKGLSQVWQILDVLWNVQPASRGTSLLRPLEHLDTRLKRSSLLFCISDFMSEDNIFASGAFKHLIKKHDFIPLILEDEQEERLPLGRGFLTVRDPETGGDVLFRLSDKQRRRYASMASERKVAMRRSLHRLNLDHLFLRPGIPYLDPLIGFFLARKRMR